MKMWGLVLVLICYLTNKSVDAQCQIIPTGIPTTPTPLILRANQIVYPTTSGHNTISFAAGALVDMACPGGHIVLNSVLITANVLPATCISGTTFLLTNRRFNWRQITCTQNPETTTRYTGNMCVHNGREIEIGYAITGGSFVRIILVCFDQTRQSTLNSNFNMIPAINQGIKGVARPPWIQGAGVFHIANVNFYYILGTQRKTINSLLGLPPSSTRYIQNGNDYFLSRGHLTAKGDMFYAGSQDGTFHFLNALPQWQTVNSGNWNQVESDVRDYAEQHNVYLQVWTGGHGVTTLPHAITGANTPLYLYVNGNKRLVPVPEFFWKVVYNPVTQYGVALISVNNPYKTAAQITQFCNDISHSLNWLYWDKNNQIKGISWACTVSSFRTTVTAFPNIHVNGLLNNTME